MKALNIVDLLWRPKTLEFNQQLSQLNLNLVILYLMALYA